MSATQAIQAAEMLIREAGRSPSECTYIAIMAVALYLFKEANAVAVVVNQSLAA